MAYIILAFTIGAMALRKPLAIFLFCFSLIATLALHGSSKLPVSDWEWYNHHFIYLFNNGLIEYFQFASYSFDSLDAMLGVKPRLTEPVTYLIAFFVQKIFGPSQVALAAFFHILFYSNLFFATWLYFRDKRLPDGTVLLALIVAILFIPNYVLVIHLLRQELALSFFMVGSVLMLTHKRFFGMSMILASMATHNSAIVPLIVILFSGIFSKYKINIFMFLLFSLGSSILIKFGSELIWLYNIRIGENSIFRWKLLVDGAFFLAFFLLAQKLKSKNGGEYELIDRTLIYSTLFFSILIFVFIDFVDIAFRLYFYIDILCFLFLFRIMELFKPGPKIIYFLAGTFLIVGFIRIFLSIERSVLPYNYQLTYVLFFA